MGRGAHAGFAAVGCAAIVALAGCGGGGERQDEDEPEGTFPVEVVRADFPARQKLAKDSRMVIDVRNAGNETIPNIAVTLEGLDEKKDSPGLADPARPVFLLNARRSSFGGTPDAQPAGPEGGDTAYVNTWALGPLQPGKVASFRWNVTAIQAVPYKLTYRVAAGLDGKAKAVVAGGQPATGTFAGTIDGEAPDTRIAADGKTVVNVEE